MHASEPAPDHDKPRGGRLVRLGEAIVEALRDLTSVIASLRSFLAEQIPDGIPQRPGSYVIKPKPLAQRVRQAREAQKMTRVELAKRVGTTPQTIAAYERGVIRRSKVEPQLLAVLGLRRDEPDADATPSLPPHARPSEPQAVPTQDQETIVTKPTTDPRLDTDYEYFAAQQLRIRRKGGAMTPLVFNRAQRYIHEQLEAQRAKAGRVRALVLKGRQQGCSTYVAGRYYHRVTRTAGLRVFILSHEEQASRNLFAIVDRFQHNCESPPSTSVANADELYFDAIDSGYKVATAGTKGVGRSATVQLFHGSEVAHWPFAQTHAAGVLQAVANEPGTEIILESTAHGMGNLFHKMWRDAEAGVSEYIAIFVPWFWQDEYRTPVAEDPRSESGAGFALDDDEREYAALHGLDAEQMAWRRAKTAELGDPTLFQQEYPATASEAFQMSGHDSYIPAALIEKARKSRAKEAGPLVLGYDPAYKGGDRHALAYRCGRRLIKVVTRMNLDTVQAAGWLKQVIDDDTPAKLFIDAGGLGVGIYDQLQAMGTPYAKIVEGVNFGGAAIEPRRLDEHGRPMGGYINRRAEMYGQFKQWLEQPAGVQIPDSDALQADACGPTYRYDSEGRLQLESKEDMRRRGALSPDMADAVVLTFARPVGPSNFNRRIVYPPTGWR